MKRSLMAAGVSLALATPVFATNGMAPVGFGQSSKGIGGAGVAYPQDSLQSAINPAGMVHLGNRWDIGAEIFIPNRTLTVDGHEFSGDGSGFLESWFIIPEFGYNRMINDDLAVGISIFGNGGMNTSYHMHPFTLGQGFCQQSPSLCGSQVGVDLMQAFFVPSVAYKFHENWSVGVGLNLVAQAFEAKGLQAFLPFSRPFIESGANKMTNNGRDFSYGASLRVGIQGELSDRVSVGATYQMKTKMSKMDKYAGLFPDQGSFDIPENYSIGLAVKATDKLDIAFDVMRVNYGKTGAIGNDSSSILGTIACYTVDPPNYCVGSVPAPGSMMGDSDGPGFGWKNQTIYKLGAAYKYSDDLTLRAGWNYGKSPVDVEGMGLMLNSLAPGVTEQHLTLGFTYNLDQDSSITGSYIRSFSNSQDGAFFDIEQVMGGAPYADLPALQAAMGGAAAPASIEMDQHAFGLSFNKRF